ncbi:serine/threonine-protein kinase [Nonomuraea sediminis]|uniref:serine/threonine-protein kinase n=1 Tax=Nonomuraea sediminis TaxID=2835864 RepID=UPI001BDC0917|nr:serine/threonine-protein kinase [Nonomuraea sediminis]
MEWSAPGYTEVRQLGTGASGRVVLAVHDDTGVKVAIKYLDERLRADPAALARFQAEARLLVTLRDQHIATLWEYIQDRYGAAIVMELVNGVSLRALLRENGTTGPEAALVVLKGSLLGLARAHGLGLVHRDYKPENVLVRDDGVSKLVDFGIAVTQGTVSHPEGTPPYMAPEMWEGLPASPATDVYAATAVFFECLTGHRPYRSTEPSVLGYQHLHAPIPAHDAPEPVRELVMRGLAKDPAERPASAQAFVEELEATARGAYGEDWEERGRRRLTALVLLLGLLLPMPQTPPPTAEVTTSFFRTVFRSMRHNAVRMAAGVSVAVAIAVVVVVVLANYNRRPTPFDVAAAVPTHSSEAAAEVGPTSPEISPETVDTPTITPSLAAEVPTTTQPPEKPPTTTEAPTTSAPPTTQPPTTKPPTTQPPTTKPPTTKPPTSAPPTTPAPPPLAVSDLSVGGVTVDANGLASGTVTFSANRTDTVTATGTWTVGGQAVRSQTLKLAGAKSYSRTLSLDLGERPCGKTVTLTVKTAPAAPGGAKSASFAVPECPAEVTRLSAAVSMDDTGRTARAVARVVTSGTGKVPLTLAFLVNGDRVDSHSVTLSGKTAYAPAFTHAFASCARGATVSVRVTAGGKDTSAETKVDCPAGVRKVSILRSAVTASGLAVAVVAVTPYDDQAVRLSVTFTLAGRTATETLTLSGQTAYTEKVAHNFDAAACGSGWRMVAATNPAADSGADSASGTLPDCQSDTPSPGDSGGDSPG